MPLAPSARSPSCARRWRSGPGPRRGRGAPGRHRGGGRARGGSSARRRSASTAATCSRRRRRAGWANVPRLPAARRPRLPDSRPGRPARRADAGDERQDDDGGTIDRRPGTGLRAAGHRGRTHALAADGRQPTVVVFTCNHCPYALAWHDRILDVARDYDDRGRARAADQPQRRRALPARLLRGDAEARARGRRLAGALPARRDPGGRARLRRQDDARRVRRRRRRAGCATAARPTPTTTTRRRTPRGCAARSTRCSAAADPDPAETEPVGCSIKWK